MQDTWTGLTVFSEREDIALELLSIGRKLADQIGTEVTLVLMQQGPEPDADRWFAHGADRVLQVRSPQLAPPRPDVQVEALWRVVGETRPEVLLIGGTSPGLEVAARLAQRLEVGCASECVELDYESGQLLLLRRVMGKFLAKERINTRPAIATIPLHRFEVPEPDPSRTGSSLSLPLDLPPSESRLIEEVEREAAESPIEDASIIVSVGRGLRGREDLPLVARLARVLGGAVAGSRPMTDDLQWLPPDVKVGLSGRTVRPDLYLACGISGQVEHIVGMRDARIVVAINTDPESPIMHEADYRVVGDLYEVLPALIQAREEQPDRPEG